MFINFFLNSEVPAKLKCNPSLGAYKEETGRLFNNNKKLRYIFVYCTFFRMHIFLIPNLLYYPPTIAVRGYSNSGHPSHFLVYAIT